MSASYVRQVQVALLVLLTVTFLGGWNMPTESGMWLAQAQADDGKDDRDHQRDKADYDHLACYEVQCIDRFDKDGHKVTHCDTEEDRVTLFNQFTDEKGKKDHDFKGDFKGQKVLVGKLTYLCVPTKKVHDDDKDDHR